jgi:pimeloyl-ACP methyl ester carboxylesterase
LIKTFLSLAIVLAVLASVFVGGKLRTDVIVRRAERRYPPQGDFITVEGIRLHYLSKGEGQPVVLLHGDGGSVDDWTMSIFDRLAEDYRVIAFDRPGFGYSQNRGKGTRAFEQVRLIHAALEKMGVQDPVVVGHSRGGNLSLIYGLVYPDHLRGVVTLAAAPYGGKVALHNRVLVVPGLGPLLAHSAYVPFGRGAVEAGLASAFSPQDAPEDYVETYAAYELRPNQLLAHAYDQVHGRALAKELASQYQHLKVPLVIVHGSADQNVPVEQARRLHRVVADARLIEIPGAGHEVMFTHPQIVDSAVETAAQP